MPARATQGLTRHDRSMSGGERDEGLGAGHQRLYRCHEDLRGIGQGELAAGMWASAEQGIRAARQPFMGGDGVQSRVKQTLRSA